MKLRLELRVAGPPAFVSELGVSPYDPMGTSSGPASDHVTVLAESEQPRMTYAPPYSWVDQSAPGGRSALFFGGLWAARAVAVIGMLVVCATAVAIGSLICVWPSGLSARPALLAFGAGLGACFLALVGTNLFVIRRLYFRAQLEGQVQRLLEIAEKKLDETQISPPESEIHRHIRIFEKEIDAVFAILGQVYGAKFGETTEDWSSPERAELAAALEVWSAKDAELWAECLRVRRSILSSGVIPDSPVELGRLTRQLRVLAAGLREQVEDRC